MNVQSYIAVCGLGHHRGNYKLIYAMRHMSSVSGLCLHATREILRGNIQAKLPRSRMLPQRGGGLLFVNIFEDRQCISREIASCFRLLLWRGEKGSACRTIPKLPVCSVFICLPLVRGQSGSLTFISHCNKDKKNDVRWLIGDSEEDFYCNKGDPALRRLCEESVMSQRHHMQPAVDGEDKIADRNKA